MAWSRSPAPTPPGVAAAARASIPVVSTMRPAAAGAGSARAQRCISWSARSASTTGPAASSGIGAASRRPWPAWRCSHSSSSLSPNRGPRSTPSRAAPSSGSASAQSTLASSPTSRDWLKATAPLTAIGTCSASSAAT